MRTPGKAPRWGKGTARGSACCHLDVLWRWRDCQPTDAVDRQQVGKAFRSGLDSRWTHIRQYGRLYVTLCAAGNHHQILRAMAALSSDSGGVPRKPLSVG
jgi:hypothetical protein